MLSHHHVGYPQHAGLLKRVSKIMDIAKLIRKKILFHYTRYIEVKKHLNIWFITIIRSICTRQSKNFFFNFLFYPICIHPLEHNPIKRGIFIHGNVLIYIKTASLGHHTTFSRNLFLYFTCILEDTTPASKVQKSQPKSKIWFYIRFLSLDHIECLLS